MPRVAKLLLLILGLLCWAAAGTTLAANSQELLERAEQLLCAGQAERALELLAGAGDSAAALELRGRCLFELNRWDEAERSFRSAVAKAEQAGDRLALGRAHIGLGLIQYKRGALEPAEAALKRGVGVLDRAGLADKAANAYMTLAEICQARRDPQSALSYLFMAEAALRAEPADPRLLEIYGRVVKLFEQQGRLKDALPYMESAYRFVTAAGDDAAGRAWCYRLARACEQLGDVERALAYEQQEYELARRLGLQQDLPAILVDLGVISFMQDKPTQGRAYFEQALELLKAAGDERQQADVLWQLADCSAKADDLPGAVEALSRCVELEQRLGLPDLERDRERLRQLKAQLGPDKGQESRP